jgi:hypothetical protein
MWTSGNLYKSIFHPNCGVAEKISCWHIEHMRRCEIFSAPCIWAKSAFLEAPFMLKAA